MAFITWFKHPDMKWSASLLYGAIALKAAAINLHGTSAWQLGSIQNCFPFTVPKVLIHSISILSTESFLFRGFRIPDASHHQLDNTTMPCKLLQQSTIV
jgi:hypothetical protein